MNLIVAGGITHDHHPSDHNATCGFTSDIQLVPTSIGGSRTDLIYRDLGIGGSGALTASFRDTADIGRAGVLRVEFLLG
jgi:hypothetical protein